MRAQLVHAHHGATCTSPPGAVASTRHAMPARSKRERCSERSGGRSDGRGDELMRGARRAVASPEALSWRAPVRSPAGPSTLARDPPPPKTQPTAQLIPPSLACLPTSPHRRLPTGDFPQGDGRRAGRVAPSGPRAGVRPVRVRSPLPSALPYEDCRQAARHAVALVARVTAQAEPRVWNGTLAMVLGGCEARHVVGGHPTAHRVRAASRAPPGDAARPVEPTPTAPPMRRKAACSRFG